MINLFEEKADLLENEMECEVEGNPYVAAVIVVLLIEKCT